jgi:hypothetical protein
MWRVLKEAFLARIRTPLLGDMPVNAVAVACFGILGFANPGFWFLGAGLEAAYLLSLVSNRRFRKWVEARSKFEESTDARVQRSELLARLDAAGRARCAALEEKCARILQLYGERQVEDFLVEGNRAALDQLGTFYIQLLAARHNLESKNAAQTESELRRQVAAFEKDVAQQNLPASVRESKSATLAILRKRLENLGRREQTLEEIDSDLVRIEAQVDLALDNALIEGKPQVISTSIDLVSHLLDGSGFDASGPIGSLGPTGSSGPIVSPGEASVARESPGSQRTQASE